MLLARLVVVARYWIIDTKEARACRGFVGEIGVHDGADRLVGKRLDDFVHIEKIEHVVPLLEMRAGSAASSR